jgi:hypothetical protein
MSHLYRRPVDAKDEYNYTNTQAVHEAACIARVSVNPRRCERPGAQHQIHYT